MAELKCGDEVLLKGTITQVRATEVVIQCGKRSAWIDKPLLSLVRAPVTVRCEKCGVERPLTDFKTLRARCEALGIPTFTGISLDVFMRLCAELAEKGVTPQQFVEGLG